MNFIRPPKAPNLPLAPADYERKYTHQINDVLRLYFNTIDNAFQALFGSGSGGSVGGGQFLKFPYGAFEDTTSQAIAANTATAMTFNTTDYANGVSVVGGSKITVANTGLYNLQWSGQFQNTDTQLQDVSVWIRINGSNLAGSTGLISIPNKHGGINGHTVVGWNYFLSLTAGDYLELYWSSPSAQVSLEAYGAGSSPTRPTTASLIATLSFVSAV
jgi:hypothetical protein